MLWALIHNKKVKPKPRLKGVCSACNGQLIAKCGDINTWHWAHHKSENCDSWFEPESDWHMHWKMTFGKENNEIVIKKEGKWHIADILTKSNIVIELQNSLIKKEVITQREEYYGERMIWVINGSKFKENFFTYPSGLFVKRDGRIIKLGENEIALKKDKFIMIPEFEFRWSYPHKSWEDAKRNVFIDFGDENLFWIKSGLGTANGIGIYVTKEKFIKKYEGDYQFYKFGK